jgi:hypothetical protein
VLNVTPDRGDLVGESTHGIAAVGQEVDDLDDRDLSTHCSFKLDIDRSRPAGVGIDRAFRTRRPALASGDRDGQLLPSQVLDVARQVSAGHSLEKRGELGIDSGRTRRQRFEGRGASCASLEPAPERLRNTRPVSRLDLGDAARQAAFAKPKADPVGKVGTSPSTR